jgi:DNA primase large subunit
MQPIQVLATYPFLNDAKQFIKEQQLTTHELLTGKLYERARTISIERLDNALKFGDVKNRQLATETDHMMEIYSYPLARMLSTAINDPYLDRRYALSEAYHAYKHLINETHSYQKKIAEELSIHHKNPTENTIDIFFKDYLRHAPTQYKKWKMINRIMDNGFVTVTYKDLSRLILEALRTKILKELELLHTNQQINTVFSAEITRFRMILNSKRKKMQTAPIGKLSIEKLPPCLKDTLAAIQSGENVPHMGRFCLVSFLNTIGMNTSEILGLFSTAPDYQEERTRYQVEHITGKSSSTKYKSPGCQKMRTYGICPTDKIDPLCRKINHPLSYYNSKWKKAQVGEKNQ